MNARFFSFLLFGFIWALPGQGATCPRETALFTRASDLYQNHQFLLSSIHFSEVSASACDESLSQKALFAYALSLAELGETSEALRNLHSLERSPFLEIRNRAKLFHAFLVPEFHSGLSSADSLRINMWDARFAPESLPALADAEVFPAAKRVELADIVNEMNHLPRKSPLLAGVLSGLIPGAGQVYVGVYESAAVAFLLNALFLSTTIELANKKLPVAAVASGMIFSVTYLGNILNATDSAKLKNNNLALPMQNRLRESLFPEFNP